MRTRIHALKTNGSQTATQQAKAKNLQSLSMVD